MACCRKQGVCVCRVGGVFAALGVLALFVVAAFALAGCGSIDFQPTVTDPQTGHKLTADEYGRVVAARERELQNEQTKAESAFKIELAKAKSEAEQRVAEVIAQYEGTEADLSNALDRLGDEWEVAMANFERQRQQRAAAWQALKSIPIVGQVANQFQLDPLASAFLGITGTGTVAAGLVSRGRKKAERRAEERAAAAAARVQAQYEDKIRTHNAAWDKSREELRQEMAMVLPDLLRARAANGGGAGG